MNINRCETLNHENLYLDLTIRILDQYHNQKEESKHEINLNPTHLFVVVKVHLHPTLINIKVLTRELPEVSKKAFWSEILWFDSGIVRSDTP